jgi:hypothetical protein
MRTSTTGYVTFVAVATITLAIGFMGAGNVKLEVKLGELVIALFTVSGTLVALTLPAAGLVGQFITQQVDFSVDRVFDAPKNERPNLAETHSKLLEQASATGRAAWRASIYSLASFIFSSSAFFTSCVQFGAYTIFLGHLLVGAALGCILAGAIWFCIPAYWLYEFKVLRATEGMFDYMVQQQSSRRAVPQLSVSPQSVPDTAISSDAKTPSSSQ